MKAILRNYRQSPRKVRLVATFLKGKPVLVALSELPLMNKRAVDPITKLVASALANAKQMGNTDAESLFIKDIRVDAGTTLRRSRPRSRGMSNPIKKRASHIYVELGIKELSKKAVKDKTEAEVAPKPKKAKVVKAKKATKSE